MDRRIPIQDESVASGKACIGAAWGLGNTFAAFSAPRIHGRDACKHDGSGEANKCGGNIHTVAFETALYTPIFRKLVNESSQTFLTLQKMALEEENIATSHLGRMSRQYRSIIRDCQEQLDIDCERTNSVHPSKVEHNQLQSELLYKLELIWHLVEVLCIEKTSSKLILSVMRKFNRNCQLIKGPCRI